MNLFSLSGSSSANSRDRIRCPVSILLSEFFLISSIRNATSCECTIAPTAGKPLPHCMYYSVHRPSRYICTHTDGLLPGWSHPVSSVLVVLQPCNTDLRQKTPVTEAQKQLLREAFLEFGYPIAMKLQHLGHLAEIFDPRTGLPLFSQPGHLHLDDVAVARACLGYQTINSYGCSIIVHPLWGSAVYPSTLLSSATPDLVESVVSWSHLPAEAPI